MQHKGRRQFLKCASWAGIGTGIGGLFSWLTPLRFAFAGPDPRPEFASTTMQQVLAFYFGSTESADDASIVITAPLVAEHNQMLPFKIKAPGAGKIAVLFDANPEPLIMAMEQPGSKSGVIVGRARLAGSGVLHCYAMRNGVVGHASLRIAVAGHWQQQVPN